MRFAYVLLTLALVLGLQGEAFGQRRTLQPGHAAPGLDIEHWEADKSMSIEADQVYLVVFVELGGRLNGTLFAILNELHTVIPDEDLHIAVIATLDRGEQFEIISLIGDEIHFSVGTDRRNSTERAWIRAAKLDGYPHGFIVDRESKIQYIADPLGDEDFFGVLQLVLDDRFDFQLMIDAARYEKPAKNARKVRNFRQCFMHMDKVIKMDKRVFAKKMLLKFEIMLLDMKDPDQAYEYAQTLIEENEDDPNFLVWLAEMIVNDPRIADDDRDLDIAMDAVVAARESFHEEEPTAYSAVAMVHFQLGEIDEAIELQKKAWRIARPFRKDEFWRTLVSYKDAAKRKRDGVDTVS